MYILKLKHTRGGGGEKKREKFKFVPGRDGRRKISEQMDLIRERTTDPYSKKKKPFRRRFRLNNYPIPIN